MADFAKAELIKYGWSEGKKKQQLIDKYKLILILT